MRPLIIAIALTVPLAATAEQADLRRIVDDHILPRTEALAEQTDALAEEARTNCATGSDELRAAYHDAFDAWVVMSHLRFGPTEEDDRAFALAFWPDTRGVTPRTLGALLDAADPVAASPEKFATVSVAARGFYALEFLLYDDAFADRGEAAYRCALLRSLTADMAANARAIHDDWSDRYADLMSGAGSNDTYRSEAEATQQLFTALTTGLQFTSDVRLGRPLASFDRPRPARAEAWRSGRSLRHVILSLQSLRDLAARLSGGDGMIDDAFAKALAEAEILDDPVFAGVDDPQSRLRVESLQTSIDGIRDLVATRLGPQLGISAGFNALDGD
ncbi:imelysin family protein [Roseovarius sp. SCSIO 43702]|uniref:imelysin family protein n=1 Tax=Roseovarius sp. SCSIO 43702 TaxID=2823043 RepID=UPI001C73D24F|nr:imelysin family protein [Roseovarius sp. SCSIO 43702]QYX57589.1 imelysin family protein [Roseovarius sp. SCSIO 43702]